MAYLVEREQQYANPKDNEMHWLGMLLTFVNPPQSGDAVSLSMIFNIGMPDRWRVWVVDKDGQIALSEWRTLQFTN